MTSTDDTLARRCADAMWADDVASKNLGMSLNEVASGHAVLSMAIRDDMTNGHGIAHGGFIFALADSAFAFACNSHNVRTVAQGCDIVFAAPARLGDLLVAEAVERHVFGRNGLYDVRVTRGGSVIAEFRGRSRTLGGPLVETEADEQSSAGGADRGSLRERPPT
ncbi:MAG: hydroxyphenylacetyl-CoA thioesterase PaaI [Nocardioidaceae bacterium]